jgi:hypothetical protein
MSANEAKIALTFEVFLLIGFLPTKSLPANSVKAQFEQRLRSKTVIIPMELKIVPYARRYLQVGPP